jgi:tetratricopeptide (TPR) repeat protein
MDLITTVVVGALGKLSETVVKDAYEKLKNTIKEKFGTKSDLAEAIENLEKKPESEGRIATLQEEIASSQAYQDTEVIEAAQALIKELNRAGSPVSSSVVSQRARDNAIQIGGSVSNSIIAVITQGISSHQFNRAQSDYYNNEGRKRIRAFGERMVREQNWDWWALAQAIEYYITSIRHDPQNQHAWINMAYVYHLIGEKKKALECLNKALDLAEPGPNYPGDHYTQVKEAVDTGSYLSGGQVNPPRMSDWFRDRYRQYL